MKNIDECSQIVKHKEIKLSEKRSKIIFLNQASREITKVQVDGCLNFKGTKCDWLLIVEEPKKIEIYVELKGSDVRHAFKQLENTIINISADKQKQIKFCYIITTKSPLSSPEIQNKAKIFKKTYNSNLRVKKTGYKEKLSTLTARKEKL